MNKVQFINIGYGNLIAANRVIAMLNPDSAPIRRLMQEAKENNALVDATYGRKTRCVIVMDNGNVVLSPNMPETVGSRFLSAKSTMEAE